MKHVGCRGPGNAIALVMQGSAAHETSVAKQVTMIF